MSRRKWRGRCNRTTKHTDDPMDISWRKWRGKEDILETQNTMMTPWRCHGGIEEEEEDAIETQNTPMTPWMCHDGNEEEDVTETHWWRHDYTIRVSLLRATELSHINVLGYRRVSLLWGQKNKHPERSKDAPLHRTKNTECVCRNIPGRLQISQFSVVLMSKLMKIYISKVDKNILFCT